MEEKPALFSLSPDLNGKTVIDLGCGYGENCAEFLRLGAREAVGIDISERMLEVARRETKNISFLRADMNNLSDVPGKYDIAFSSLAVHYIEDFCRLCFQVAALLNSGGYFIFSQEHPLTTANTDDICWTKNEKGERLYYHLSNYCVSGKREINWFVDGVVKYHRTFSDIVNALTDAGFMVEKVLEPNPYTNNIHKPNFLLIRARKV